MIVGVVEPSGEAVVVLGVRGPQGATVEFRTVVDTGFNDWIVLPAVEIEALGLPFREEGRYGLADGTEAVSRLFAAEVEWMGQWRGILIVEMEGGPLLGMAMIRGAYLGIEVIDGGRVEIRALTE